MQATATATGTVSAVRTIQRHRRTAWGDSQHLAVLFFDPPLPGVGSVGAVSSITSEHHGWTGYSHRIVAWDLAGAPWGDPEGDGRDGFDAGPNPIRVDYDAAVESASNYGEPDPTVPRLREWLASLGYHSPWPL
jgi:hypothetical protein